MQTTQLTTLIIDDSPLIRARLEEILSNIDGVENVETAACASEGLEFAGALKPGLVVLDIKMPGVSGLDILYSMKQTRPSPVVIVLTNYPYMSYRLCCMRLGADYFLDKSSEFFKVRDIVMNVLGDEAGRLR